MKHIILTSLLIITCVATRGQSFMPINTQDTAGIWSIWDEKYFFLGDSAFDGHQYKKLWKIEDSIFSVAQRTYAGLFREGSTGKAWLCYPGAREKVLFDLNRSIGDTMRVVSLFSPNSPASPFNSDSTITVEVLAVDSVMINGTGHRRLAINNIPFSYQQHEYWIEGIGSTAGLPYSGQGNMVATIWWSILLCYEENGQTVYADSSTFSSCYEVPPMSIEENSLSNALQFYPNPATDVVNINMAGLQGQAALSLYNLQGQKLHSQMLEFTNGQATFLLPVGLPKGSYMVNLKTKTAEHTSKLLVL